MSRLDGVSALSSVSALAAAVAKAGATPAALPWETLPEPPGSMDMDALAAMLWPPQTAAEVALEGDGASDTASVARTPYPHIVLADARYVKYFKQVAWWYARVISV